MLNIVAIQAIRKSSSLLKTLKTLLLSLAVSDLGDGLLVQPLFVASVVMELQQNNEFYVATNMVFTVKSVLFSLSSFFGIIVLSTGRFLAIHFLLLYKDLVTQKRVAAVVISIWLFSAFFSLISLQKPPNIFLAFAIIELTCEIAATYSTFKVYRVARSHLNELEAMELWALLSKHHRMAIW